MRRTGAGGPAPLTQIHFQDLVPQPGGGAQVNVTTQPFDIPVCGAGGASGSTVTSYEPTNFCVNQGDYVDFNDEGGFEPADPLAYPSGVPYKVLGAVGVRRWTPSSPTTVSATAPCSPRPS